MSDVKSEHKEWAQYFKGMVPGNISVNRYYDETDTAGVDIMRAETDEGVVVATIGVMEANQSRSEGLVFTEIIMDVMGENTIVENVLSTIAFYLLKNDWRAAPGVIFERIVEMYDPSTSLPHIMFVPPFQWESGMSKVQLSSKVIYPLLAVPITAAESALAEQRGADALMTLWEEAETNVLDWSRD